MRNLQIADPAWASTIQKKVDGFLVYGAFVAAVRHLYIREGRAKNLPVSPSFARAACVGANGRVITINHELSAPKAYYTDDMGLTLTGPISLPSVGDYPYSGVASNGSGTVIAVAQARAARSTDNGASWSSLATLPGRTWTDLVYTNGAFIAVGYAGVAPFTRIAVSLDNGDNWTETSLAGVGGNVRVSASGDNVMALAAQGTQVYTSTDKGANWTTINNPTTTSVWKDVSVMPNGGFCIVNTSAFTVATTTDMGGNWNTVSLPLSSARFNTLESGGGQVIVYPGVRPTDSSTIGPNTVLFSNDNGSTWAVGTLTSTQSLTAYRQLTAIYVTLP